MPVVGGLGQTKGASAVSRSERAPRGHPLPPRGASLPPSLPQTKDEPLTILHRRRRSRWVCLASPPGCWWARAWASVHGEVAAVGRPRRPRSLHLAVGAPAVGCWSYCSGGGSDGRGWRPRACHLEEERCPSGLNGRNILAGRRLGWRCGGRQEPRPRLSLRRLPSRAAAHCPIVCPPEPWAGCPQRPQFGHDFATSSPHTERDPGGWRSRSDPPRFSHKTRSHAS